MEECVCMRKHMLSVLLMILVMSLLFVSCGVLHKHNYGEWHYNGSMHFRDCSCGSTLFESPSKHIDKDRDEKCDICRYPMKYTINSLRDLSWYLLYYYEENQFDYFKENNMKIHNIHDVNFKNTLKYNEKKTRVDFEESDFNEYLTAMPMHEEYVKSNAEYYSYYQASGYLQPNVSVKRYSFWTQETIRYGLSEQNCDYKRFIETKSDFETVNDFDDATFSTSLTKTIYKDSECYNAHTMSVKHDILHSVANGISYFIRYYLNVEFSEYGEIILPELSYFNNFDVRTEENIVYFNIEKNDGETFFDEDIRYSISGSINLKTHNLSYNVKKSNYSDGEIMRYVDYDYDLTLTNEPIEIEFDFNGEFEEFYIENY